MDWCADTLRDGRRKDHRVQTEESEFFHYPGLVVSATRGHSPLERHKTKLFCCLFIGERKQKLRVGLPHPLMQTAELNVAPEAETLSIMELSPITEG